MVSSIDYLMSIAKVSNNVKSLISIFFNLDDVATTAEPHSIIRGIVESAWRKAQNLFFIGKAGRL